MILIIDILKYYYFDCTFSLYIIYYWYYIWIDIVFLLCNTQTTLYYLKVCPLYTSVSFRFFAELKELQITQHNDTCYKILKTWKHFWIGNSCLSLMQLINHLLTLLWIFIRILGIKLRSIMCTLSTHYQNCAAIANSAVD